MTPIVEVEKLSKKYNIMHKKSASYDTFSEAVINQFKKIGKKVFLPFHKTESLSSFISEDFWALKDLSFKVEPGEKIGIIGRNGAGKSTLLKILSRITQPTSGMITIRGQVASLLEVGTGFHPELSGRENIYLNGSILGMNRKDIKKQFDEIVDFSGVENFLDTPLKRYSSGMAVRLAFSVAAHLNPEVLVVDEVLAVGDSAFQKKCLGKMQDVSRKKSKTIFFVSHNMQAILSLCSKALFLKQGKMLYFGDVSKAINMYFEEDENLKERLLKWEEKKPNPEFLSSIRIDSFWIEDEGGNIPKGVLFKSKRYTVNIALEIFKTELDLGMFVSYYTDKDELLFISDIHDCGNQIKQLTPGKKLIQTAVPIDFFLTKAYKIEFSCVIHNHGWPLSPSHKQRLFFKVARDIPKNLSYNEELHPFTGADQPGFLAPPINWEIKEL